VVKPILGFAISGINKPTTNPKKNKSRPKKMSLSDWCFFVIILVIYLSLIK